MIIKGTEKIKGVLDLASVKLQLGKKSVYNISDNDFWNSDVQAALRMGYISSAGSPDPTNEDAEKVVKCVNIHRAPINVLGKQIDMKHTFTITEKELKNPDIKLAIDRGMIKVLQVVDTKDVTEGFMKLGELFDKEEAKKRKIKEKQAKEFKEQLRQKKELETNENLPTMTKVIDNENPDPVQPPTDKKKTIIWNPTGERVISTAKGAVVATGNDSVVKIGVKDARKKSKIADAIRTGPTPFAPEDNTEIVNGQEQEIEDVIPEKRIEGQIPTHVIDDPNPYPVDPLTDDPRKNTVIVDPGRNKPHALSYKEVDDILFVDEEEDAKRIQKHPKLKDQEIKREINDPIAEDNDAAKIAKHPVLGKQENQNEELEFVD